MLLNIIFNLILISIFEISAEDIRLYSPHSVFELNLNTKNCINGQTSSLISFVQDSIHYAIVNEGQCGFGIYNLGQLDSPSQEYQEQIDGFFCTEIYLDKDSFRLWVAFSNGFTNLYQLNMGKSSQVALLSTFKTPNSDITFFIKRNPKVINQLFFFSPKSMFTFVDDQVGNQLQLIQSQDQDFANAYQISIIGQSQFVFVATQNKGIQMIQLIENNNPSNNQMSYNFGKVCFLNPAIYTISSFDMLNQNVVVMMQIILGVYVYDISGYVNSQGTDCSSTSFKLLYRVINQTLGSKVILSADKKYAFASYKSVGIYIYEINQTGATQIQIIWQLGNAAAHILSENEQLLLSTNSLGFLGYQATKPNLNNIQPNLLLNYQQLQIVPAVQKPTGQDRDCFYNEKARLLFLVAPSYSFCVIQYQGNGVYEKKFAHLNSGNRIIIYAIMLSDLKTVIIATRNTGIGIMDFTDYANPTFVKEGLKFGLSQLNLSTMYLSKDESFMVLTDNSKAVFIDIKDPINPTLISTYDITVDGNIPPLRRAAFSIDNKTIFLGTSSDTILSLDITNLSTPVFLHKIPVEGVYEIKVTQDGKHLIFAQLFRGVVVVDIQNPSKMKIISSVSVLGAAISVNLIQNDQYIIMTSIGNPSIKLIDFRDRLNPKGMQLFYLQSRAYDFVNICKTDQDQTIFISSNNNLLVLNLKNTLNLHTQIYNVQKSDTSNSEKLSILDPSQPFLVGQKIKMNFLNVKDLAMVKITDAFHYINDSIQQLPSWIVFSQMSNQLYFQITKESQNIQVDTEIQVTSLQQVILRVLRQILDNSFINSYLKITNAQSLILKNACIKKRYIDSDNYVSSYFEPLGFFELDPPDLSQITTDINQQKAITQFVLYILKQNIVYYTIQFQIQPSLIIDFDNQEQPISTTQNQISLYITCIVPSQGKFVFIQYPSVLVVYSELQNQIKIEGTLSNVNHILSNKIKFSNSTDSTIIKFNLLVSDGVNFDFIKNFNLNELPIITLQDQVKIEQSRNLQQYFNDKYESGEIEINSYFSFQIPNGHFISDSNYPLIFKAYQLSQKEYNIFKNKNTPVEIQQQTQPTTLPKSLWIQFSSTDQVFSGVPESRVLFNNYYLLINATDGYTYAVEPLHIYIGSVPFSYIIQLMIQICGPLFGILGLWRYKHIFFNYFFKKYYLYSKEITYVGEDYQKHIYLYGNSLSQAQTICTSFLPKLFKNKFIDDQISILLALQKKKSQINSSNPFQSIPEKIQQSVQFALNENNVKSIYQRSQSQQLQSDINENIKSLQAQTPNKKKDNSQEKSYMNKSGSLFILNETKKLERKMTQYMKAKNLSDSEELQLFKQDGHINMSFVLSELKQLMENTKGKKNIEIISELENSKSATSQIIGGLTIHYLLKKIKAAQCIYNHMRKLATKSRITKDWYKAFVDIVISQNSEELCFFNQFKINEKKFQNAFDESIQIIQNIDSLKKEKDDLININLSTFLFLIPLVQDSIVATAQGISYEKPGMTFKSAGESINCYQHNIKTIKAYQKVNQNNKNCIKQLKIQEYKEKFLIHNQMLPHWIKRIELVDNIIIIQGIPERQNVGTTLFKILNEFNIVQFAFEIEIRKPQFEEMINQQSQNQFTAHNNDGKLKTQQEQTFVTQEQQEILKQYSYKDNVEEEETDQQNDIFAVDQIIIPPIYFSTRSNQNQFYQ